MKDVITWGQNVLMRKHILPICMKKDMKAKEENMQVDVGAWKG